MNTRNERREAAVERMADHVLSEGLSAATLRPLAAAAGTSDRMLLYYFADRDEILAATLHKIAERLVILLDAAIPIGKPRPFHTLLEEVRTVLGSENIRPFMHVFLDLSSGAARGREPHLHVAGQIADGFLAWIKSRLKPEPHRDVDALAALFMALVEGMHVLEAIGRPGIGEAAATELCRVLQR